MGWVEKNTGKRIDVDGMYGAQCVDLVNGYARDVHKMKYSRGHGKDKVTNFCRDYGWKFISPKDKAQIGDVVSWDSSWGGGYGHTGVVISDTGTYLKVFDQNPKAPTVRTVRKDGLVGYARPTRYIQPAPAPKPKPSSTGTYTVKTGDSLWAIAKAHKMTLEDLCKINGISSKATIYTGQTLKVTPQIKTHTVKAGETLSGIATKYATTVAKIVSLNNIPNPNIITVGQRLRVA